jgi:uncharacterized protein YndB with AHSA1/START domain
MSDIIVKSIEIAAPVSRVLQALTDYRQFGKWFRVNLEGPFVPGKVARGPITYPGYEHIIFEAQIEKMEPERYFSLRWHPYAVDPDVDYSGEPTTLVEFRLQPKGAGTVITVTESGFDAIPKHRRAEAYRMNDGGWAEQMSNIQRHVQLATSTA